jgi:hypothetical protein
MAWTDPFWKPIKLNDRRVLTTLDDARELISTLPPTAQVAERWLDAEEMLARAAIAPSARDDALAMMLIALKTEGPYLIAPATAPQLSRISDRPTAHARRQLYG